MSNAGTFKITRNSGESWLDAGIRYAGRMRNDFLESYHHLRGLGRSEENAVWGGLWAWDLLPLNDEQTDPGAHEWTP